VLLVAAAAALLVGFGLIRSQKPSWLAKPLYVTGDLLFSLGAIVMVVGVFWWLAHWLVGWDERREGIPEDVRVAVWGRYGGRCVRCRSQESLGFEHFVPISEGGRNEVGNIRLLCKDCRASRQ
jgi:hypothetical protein